MVDLNGVNCLLMTPFDKDGNVDFNSLAVVADDVIKGGVNSVVGNGKIGEFEVLTPEERREIIDMLVSYVGGKVPVGFGIINATYEEGISLSKHAASAGADFVMSRPPVDGDINRYFTEIADEIALMPYDQGTRGELSIKEDILPLCEKSENIVGLKISGNPDKIIEAKELLDVPVLCGWDLMSLLAYEMGSDGVISGSACLVPEDEVEMYKYSKANNWNAAREIYYAKVLPFLIYCTFDPFAYSVCKYVLYWKGLIKTKDVRLPNPDAGDKRVRELYEMLKIIDVDIKDDLVELNG